MAITGMSQTASKIKRESDKKKKSDDLKRYSPGDVAPPEKWANRERSAGSPNNNWGANNTPGFMASAAFQNAPSYPPYMSPDRTRLAGGGQSDATSLAQHQVAPPSGVQNYLAGGTGGGAVAPGALGTTAGQAGGGNFQGAGNNTMDPTMAGLGYSPQGASTLYGNPEALAMDVLLQQGIDNPAMASMISDYFWPALYQQLLQTGGYGDQSDPATMGRIFDMMTQYITPGGSMPDSNSLMQTIFGATPGNGPLGALAMGDPQSQVKDVNSAMQGARYGMNPLMQKMYQNAIDWYQTKYLNESLKNPSAAQPYTTYLANSDLGSWSR